MISITYFNGYGYDLRYMQLLLEYGADPNYAIEEDFVNVLGHSQHIASPLILASDLNLDMVKLLIKYGADPYKRLGQSQSTGFESALMGNINKYKIINYYIDSLHIDVKAPMYIRPIGDTLYIQDYVRKFSFEKEEEGLEIKRKLEKMGVDFRNYKYKEW